MFRVFHDNVRVHEIRNAKQLSVQGRPDTVSRSAQAA